MPHNEVGMVHLCGEGTRYGDEQDAMIAEINCSKYTITLGIHNSILPNIPHCIQTSCTLGGSKVTAKITKGKLL